MNDNEPSEEFYRAFSSGGGGIVRTCACGITWFNYMDHGCFDEGELEGLEAKQAADPEKYRAVDYTVETYYLGDKEFVMGCVCEDGKRMEQWLINHARSIAEYLNLRADKLLKDAEEEAKATRVHE